MADAVAFPAPLLVLPNERAAVPDPGALNAPLIPFADKEGTITKRILTSVNMQEGGADLASQLRTAYTTNFSGVTGMSQQGRNERYQAISAELLASPVFQAFFTVMDEGGEAMLYLVHTIKRYSLGIGATAPFSGRIFGFLGEVSDGQLPQLVILSEQVSLPMLVMLSPLFPPAAATITTFFADPNRVGLVPGPAANAANDLAVSLPILAYCPTSWAPYFMAPMPIHQGYTLFKRLVDMADASIAIETTKLGNWFRFACMRAGDNAPAMSLSSIPAVFVPMVVNAPVRTWSASMVAPFVSSLPTPAMVPAGLPPPVAHPPIAPPLEKEPYTKAVLSGAELEYLFRVAGCSDDQAIDDDQSGGDVAQQTLDQVPAIWQSLVQEGRTKSRFSRLLAMAVAPGPAINFLAPVPIQVTTDMVSDFLELKFGYYDGDICYASCHRGLSPFTVPQLSMEQTNKRRRYDLQLERVTTITIKDAAITESIPSASPANYAALTKQLEAYVRLGHGLVGARCEHFIQVNKIRMVLATHYDQWTDMTATECANLLWTVFLDSRQFFKAGYEFNSLPRSTLALLIRQMEAGQRLEASRGTPLARLLGHPPRTADIDTLDADIAPQRQGATGSAGNHTMVVPPAIAAEIAKIIAASPNASPFMLLQHEKAADLHLGPPRSCMALRLFGACNSPNCTYSHAKAPAQAANLSRVLATLKNVTKSIRVAKAPSAKVKSETPAPS
jgi:hypothetical protein